MAKVVKCVHSGMFTALKVGETYVVIHEFIGKTGVKFYRLKDMEPSFWDVNRFIDVSITTRQCKRLMRTKYVKDHI